MNCYKNPEVPSKGDWYPSIWNKDKVSSK